MVDRNVMRETADQAVEISEQLGATLDYSVMSIYVLEGILEALSTINAEQSFDEEVLSGMAGTYGVYLGECMLRHGLENAGYSWGEDYDGEPCLIRDHVPDGMSINKMVPITKVYKRLVNGPEDSVSHFYNMTFAMVGVEPGSGDAASAPEISFLNNGSTEVDVGISDKSAGIDAGKSAGF